LYPQNHDALVEQSIDVYISRSDTAQYSIKTIENTRIKYVSERFRKEMTQTFSSSYLHPIHKITYSYDDEHYTMKDVKQTTPVYTDVLMNDDVEYYFNLPKVPESGSILEYTCERGCLSYSFLPAISVPGIDTLTSFLIVIHHPPEIKPRFNILPGQNPLHYTVDASADTLTRLKITDVKPPKPLEYFNVTTLAGIAVISIEKNGKEILPINGKGIISWYDSLAGLHPRLDSTDRSILADTLATQTNDRDKTKIIYDFVRKNFRYSAQWTKLSSLVPRKPSDILKSRYADCKERAALICAIAAEHNIPIYAALFPKMSAPNSDLVYPQEFDHIINAYIAPHDTIFFDATSPHAPFGVLPADEVDSKAYLLDSANPQWITLHDTVSKPALTVEISGNIDSLNHASGIITLSKQNFMNYVMMKKISSASNFEKEVSSFLSGYINNTKFEDIKEDTCGEDYVKLHATVDITSFFIKTSKNLYAPKSIFGLWTGNIDERQSDTLYLLFKDRMSASVDIKLFAPALHPLAQNFQTGNPEQLYFYAGVEPSSADILHLHYTVSQNHRVINNEYKPAFFETFNRYKKAKTDLFNLGGNRIEKVTAH
jgi:hypothetical protein